MIGLGQKYLVYPTHGYRPDRCSGALSVSSQASVRRCYCRSDQNLLSAVKRTTASPWDKEISSGIKSYLIQRASANTGEINVTAQSCTSQNTYTHHYTAFISKIIGILLRKLNWRGGGDIVSSQQSVMRNRTARMIDHYRESTETLASVGQWEQSFLVTSKRPVQRASVNTDEINVATRSCSSQDRPCHHHAIFIPQLAGVFLILLLAILHTPAHAKASESRFDQIVLQAAAKHQVDPALVLAVIKTESWFDPLAVSKIKRQGKWVRGAEGLMQLMPATAKRFKVRNSFDPQQNIHGGTEYLAWLIKRFNGNLKYALAGYNAGEGRVIKYNGIPPFKETRNYVKKVMRYYREFKGVSHSRVNLARKHQPTQRKKTNKTITLTRLNKKKKPVIRKLARIQPKVDRNEKSTRISSLTLVRNSRPVTGYTRIRARQGGRS